MFHSHACSLFFFFFFFFLFFETAPNRARASSFARANFPERTVTGHRPGYLNQILIMMRSPLAGPCPGPARARDTAQDTAKQRPGKFTGTTKYEARVLLRTSARNSERFTQQRRVCCALMAADGGRGAYVSRLTGGPY